MATCSSILAWRIPWTEEPGGLQSMGDTTIAFNTFRGARTALGEEGLKPKDRKR